MPSAVARSRAACTTAKIAPVVASTPVAANSSLVDPPPRIGAPSQAVDNGGVIDLRGARAVLVLQPTLPTFETSDATRAYIIGKDGALRAYDLASGAEVWNAGAAGDTRSGVQGDEALFFPRAADVWVVDKATGAARTWPSPQRVAQVLPLGSRVALLHESGVVDIRDARTGQSMLVLARSRP